MNKTKLKYIVLHVRFNVKLLRKQDEEMKARKVLCTILAAAMTFGAAVCGGAAKADGESGSITLGI